MVSDTEAYHGQAEPEGRVVQVEAVQARLPPDLDLLRIDAHAERFRFVERLVDEWASGANRFSRNGEALLLARVDGTLAGIGGLTLEAALPDAFRMRRFYVRPSCRRLSIGRHLAAALLARPRQPGTTITVNAGTATAPAF